MCIRDSFMSEARAVTNFSGNAVATILVGSWTGTIDKNRVDDVLSGRDPFDENNMVDDHLGSSPTRPDATNEDSTTAVPAEKVSTKKAPATRDLVAQ